MFFNDPKRSRRQCEPMNLDGNELAIPQFLATSRRYLDIPPTGGACRSAGVVQEAPAARFAKGRRGHGRRRCRTIVSSVLLASSLGVGGPLTAYAVVDCGASASMHERYCRRVEEHRQQLREALKLAPDQEQAWEKLVATEQALRERECAGSDDWAALPSTGRADRMLEHLLVHLARMSEHVAALKDFHAALTPAQRKSFDEFHALPRSMFAARSRRDSDTATG